MNDSRVLVIQLVGCLDQGLADVELMERDQVLLVIVNRGVFFDLLLLALFCTIFFLLVLIDELDKLFGKLDLFIGHLCLNTVFHSLVKRCLLVGCRSILVKGPTISLVRFGEVPQLVGASYEACRMLFVRFWLRISIVQDHRVTEQDLFILGLGLSGLNLLLLLLLPGGSFHF